MRCSCCEQPPPPLLLLLLLLLLLVAVGSSCRCEAADQARAPTYHACEASEHQGWGELLFLEPHGRTTLLPPPTSPTACLPSTTLRSVVALALGPAGSNELTVTSLHSLPTLTLQACALALLLLSPTRASTGSCLASPHLGAAMSCDWMLERFSLGKLPPPPFAAARDAPAAAALTAAISDGVPARPPACMRRCRAGAAPRFGGAASASPRAPPAAMR